MRTYLLIASVLLFGGCATMQKLNEFPQKRADAASEQQVDVGVERVDYIPLKKIETPVNHEVEILDQAPNKPYTKIGKFESREGDSYSESYETLLSYAKKRVAREGADAIVNLQMNTQTVGEHGNVYASENSGIYKRRAIVKKSVTGEAIRFD